MIDIEKYQQAKTFIDKLANGINPLDDMPIPDGDILNDVRLVRGMFLVSDVLREVCEDAKQPRRRTKSTKVPFSITPEEAAAYVFPERLISMTEFVQRVNALVDHSQMRRLHYKDVVYWLFHIGMLCEKENHRGKKTKFPTDVGMEIGISHEIRFSARGEYDAVLYNRDAQQFILDHMEAIVLYKEQG